jgi:hypothetical protein
MGELEKSLTEAGGLLMSSAMCNRPVMIFEVARVLQDLRRREIALVRVIQLWEQSAAYLVNPSVASSS